MSSYTFSGPPNRFPGPTDTFPGYIGPFPGLILMKILIFYPRLVQWSGGKISIFSSKMVQETIQYGQEMCDWSQRRTSLTQKIYEPIFAKISIFPSKMVHETIQYAQEMSQEAPGNVSRTFRKFPHFPEYVSWQYFLGLKTYRPWHYHKNQ